MPILPILCVSENPDWKPWRVMIRITNSSACGLDWKLSNYRPQTKFAKVMFLHRSVILSTGWGVLSQHALQVVSQHALQVSRGGLSQHALQVSRPTPEGSLRGLAGGGGFQVHTWGGSRPTLGGRGGGLQAHTQGCIPACTEADPLSWRLLLRVVCILLECILVLFEILLC